MKLSEGVENSLIYYDLYRASAPRSPTIGKTLILLGTSNDGPIKEPIMVLNPTQAASIFGDPGNGTLLKGYQQVYDTDKTITVYLVRFTGDYATLDLTGLTSKYKVDTLLRFRSKYGGSLYNQVCIMLDYMVDPVDDISKACLRLIFPDSYNISPKLYFLSDFSTLGRLCQSINQDTDSGQSLVYASTPYGLESSQAIVGPNLNLRANLIGGNDGVTLSKNDLYVELNETYGLLEGIYADIILPLGVYFDDVHPVTIYGENSWGDGYYSDGDDVLDLVDVKNNYKACTFHGQLIDFCMRQMNFGFMTHGVLGFKPITNVSDVTTEYSYIVKLANATAFKTRFDLTVFDGGEYIDQGYYVSLVAAEAVFNEGLETEYTDNCAAIYAAMLTNLGASATPTNQPIPGLNTLRYEFTTNEIYELSNMGIVTFRYSVNSESLVISSGVTAALSSSDLHSMINVRQVQAVLSEINLLVNNVIGEPYTPIIKKKEMDKQLNEKLNALKTAKVIQDFRVSISFNNNGRGYIALDLLTLYAIDFISTSAGVMFTNP